jgi:hypothetical protein
MKRFHQQLTFLLRVTLRLLFVQAIFLIMGTSVPAFSASLTLGASNSLRESADVKPYFPIAVDGDFEGGIPYISIINRGPDIARNVTLHISISEGLVFDSIENMFNRPVTFSLPRYKTTGEVVCFLGDLAPNENVGAINYFYSLVGNPGTRTKLEITAASDTFDPDVLNNKIEFSSIIPPVPKIESAEIVQNPFRIKVKGENLAISVSFFGLTPFGIGCDCQRFPRELVHDVVGENAVILEGGPALKAKVPKGGPTQICYRDRYRVKELTTSVTR